MTPSEEKFIFNLYDSKYQRMKKDIARVSKAKESPSEGFEDYFNRTDRK